MAQWVRPVLWFHIPEKYWFKSQLLHFRTSFLLMDLGKQWKMVQVLGRSEWNYTSRESLYVFIYLKVRTRGPSAMAQWINPLFALNTPGIPYGQRFESQQLHFPSSSLLVVWESSRGEPKTLETCTCIGEPEETLLLLTLEGLSCSYCGHLESEPVDEKPLYLFFSLY